MVLVWPYREVFPGIELRFATKPVMRQFICTRICSVFAPTLKNYAQQNQNFVYEDMYPVGAVSLIQALKKI
jgi:hypothetical protein